MKTFVLLLMLALLAIPSAVSATNSKVQPRIETQPGLDRTDGFSVPAPASFAGTWKTARRCAPYTVILTQVGDKVTGTFSPGNGKLFDGVVTDETLRFKWTEDGGEGFGGGGAWAGAVSVEEKHESGHRWVSVGFVVNTNARRGR